MGAFTVYVDGARAGIAPVQGQLELKVRPGPHSVRIGQSLARALEFRSPQLTLNMAPASVTWLRADIPRELPLLRRFAKFALSPRSCLVLQESVAHVANPVRVQQSLAASDTAKRGLAAQGLVGTIGLVLLFVGLKVGVALAAVGAGLFLAGTVLGIVGMVRAKGLDSASGDTAD